MTSAGLPRVVDAVVVGAGHNGLVAANRLADAGWDTLVLEAQPEVGGAVASDRDVHPEFVTDTFSAFYPMAAASPVIRHLRLEDFGLQWQHAPAVLGHPRPDGRWAILHRDLDVTADLLDAEHPGDGAAWRDLCRRWEKVGPALVDAMLSPLPPVRGGLRTLLRLPGAGGLSFVRELLTPAAQQFSGVFGGEAPRLLFSGNACHADIPVDAAGSGLFGLLLAMLGQTVGWPVPEGGAGRLSAALRDRLLTAGGTVECDAEVDRVVVRDGHAVGVEVRGQLVEVRRAVLADVHVEQLYGGLVAVTELPARLRRQMRMFRRDPATLKIDFALDGPVPWATAPPYAPGTVHIADSPTELSRYSAQVAAGVVPDRPFLLIGQMTTTDPSRSPTGTESMWAYTHVPQQVRADAGGTVTGRWDDAETEQFAARMVSRIEQYAPGFRDHIIAQRVLTPRDLEARDAALVGGSLNGGTAALDQQLIFRPVPGTGRPTTPIAGLYLASASAHPGGSVHGACGMNAARAALLHAPFRGRRLLSSPTRHSAASLEP